MDSPISISALFTKAVTTVDGGWRITFDVGQSETKNIGCLADLKDQILHVVVMTEEQVRKHKKLK